MLPLPYVGRLEGAGDTGRIRIRVQADNWRGTALVPQEQVSYLGDGAHTASVLRTLTKGSLAFEPGEAVRFRDAGTGRVRDGRFVRRVDGPDAKKYAVEDEAGAVVELPSRLVYKRVGNGASRTPGFQLDDEGPWASFDPGRRNLTALFLDAAARFVSNPGFLASDDATRLLHLVSFVRIFVVADTNAEHVEFMGLRTFSEVLAAGFGVCRHAATLLASVLNEAGYRARLTADTEPGKDGHAWVEVEGRDGTLWIADPTANVVTTISQARASNLLHAPRYVAASRRKIPMPDASPAGN